MELSYLVELMINSTRTGSSECKEGSAVLKFPGAGNETRAGSVCVEEASFPRPNKQTLGLSVSWNMKFFFACSGDWQKKTQPLLRFGLDVLDLVSMISPFHTGLNSGKCMLKSCGVVHSVQ